MARVAWWSPKARDQQRQSAGVVRNGDLGAHREPFADVRIRSGSGLRVHRRVGAPRSSGRKQPQGLEVYHANVSLDSEPIDVVVLLGAHISERDVHVARPDEARRSPRS